MTDDILVRLRECLSAATSLELEAADEIEKLRSALKPFALCNPIERDDDWFVNELRIEYFRAAKAVLGGSDE